MTSILIAERDASIAELLRTTVSRVVDGEITIASDATESSNLLDSRTFDLLLLDIGMYSDGLETLRRVKGRNARCEIIALTTGVIPSSLVKTLAAADVYAVVSKPFDFKQLGEIIGEALRHDRESQPNRPLIYRFGTEGPTRE